MDIQLDTGKAEASKTRRASNTSTSATKNISNKESPNEQMAGAIIGYIKVKEAEAVQPGNMSHSLSVELEQSMQSQSSTEKIELLEKLISVVMRRIEQSKTDDDRKHCSAA
jgi:folate-dependent tRNA-U54 methylase TrmFO/GidA